MEFVRKSTISLACFILFISLTFFGAALAIREVVGQPAPIESALSQTNAYSSIVTNFVQSHQDATTIGVPLTIPAVQTALQKAFPQSVVEPAVNQLISGTYAWAQGKTATLTFRIDLTGAKTNLANYIQQAAEQQAAKLPTCTGSQLPNVQLMLQNPLAANCLPPQISTTAVGDYAKQAVLTSSFLQDPVLTPASLHLTSNNQLKLPSQQSQSSQTVSLPHIYHQLMESIYVSVILSILCIGAIIWLHRDHIRGAGRAGVTIAGAGFVCIVDALIAGEIPKLLNGKLSSSAGQQITSAFQQTITKVLTILAEDFHRWLLLYGIILFVVGIGMWAGGFFWRRKQKVPNAPVTETTAIPSSPVPTA